MTATLISSINRVIIMNIEPYDLNDVQVKKIKDLFSLCRKSRLPKYYIKFNTIFWSLEK